MDSVLEMLQSYNLNRQVSHDDLIRHIGILAQIPMAVTITSEPTFQLLEELLEGIEKDKVVENDNRFLVYCSCNVD